MITRFGAPAGLPARRPGRMNIGALMMSRIEMFLSADNSEFRAPWERKGYGESMPAPQHDEELERQRDPWPARAREWYRAALALAFVFASLPLTSRLFLGSWGFEGAPGIACLCLVAAAYLYLSSRESTPPIPDSAAILGEAIRLAASGEADQGIALLDEAFRLNPGLWQAREYRGQIRLGKSAAAESALQDFTDAIRLAPAEPHLYILRSHVYSLLGRESAARADLETAAQLRGEYPEDSL